MAKATYRFDILSLAPQVFESLSSYGVTGRAISSNIAELNFYNPRDFTTDNYSKVDDEPYGGGAGMVLKPEPFFAAFDSIPFSASRKVLLMSPQGRNLYQNDLQNWSSLDQLILICGQYEGFDERIRTLADEEVSIGDYILTGGELPAMIIINGVLRLLPGTLGAPESLDEESHTDTLLSYPQYTRPSEFRGMKVPNVLRSGDHGAIAAWRLSQRKDRTRKRRPDLFKRWLLSQSSSNKERDEI